MSEIKTEQPTALEPQPKATEVALNTTDGTRLDKKEVRRAAHEHSILRSTPLDHDPSYIQDVETAPQHVMQVLQALMGQEPGTPLDHGAAVQLVEQYQGNTDHRIGVDGTRNGETFALQVDGIIGPCTWRSMLHDAQEILKAGPSDPRYEQTLKVMQALYKVEGGPDAVAQVLGRLEEDLGTLAQTFTKYAAFYGLVIDPEKQKLVFDQSFLQEIQLMNATEAARWNPNRVSPRARAGEYYVEATIDDIKNYVNKNKRALGIWEDIDDDGAARILQTLKVIRKAESGNGIGESGYSAANPHSSARGAYQFMRSTVADLRRWGVVSHNEPFPANDSAEGRLAQDFAAIALMGAKRGVLDDIASGDNVGRSTFALSQEWAGLPKDTSNRSFYHGDGLNRATVGITEVHAALTATASPQASEAA